MDPQFSEFSDSRRALDLRADASSLRTPVINAVPFGVLITRRDGHAVFANTSWARLTGGGDGRWRAQGWLEVCDDPTRESVMAAVVAGAELGTDLAVRDGPERGRVLRLQVTRHPEEVDAWAVVTLADVTEDRAIAARLLDRATHDGLTGLVNRAQFVEFLGHALDRRRRDPKGVIAVLFVDVDDLKGTNDTFGHDAGDRLLRLVAARLAAAVRPADVVARYGGDEFTVLCEDLRDAEEAQIIARRIIAAVDAADEGRQFSVSVGMAIADDPHVDPSSIINRADRSMYRAKRSRSRDDR